VVLGVRTWLMLVSSSRNTAGVLANAQEGRVKMQRPWSHVAALGASGVKHNAAPRAAAIGKQAGPKTGCGAGASRKPHAAARQTTPHLILLMTVPLSAPLRTVCSRLRTVAGAMLP
jgi:hypothetical protein